MPDGAVVMRRCESGAVRCDAVRCSTAQRSAVWWASREA